MDEMYTIKGQTLTDIGDALRRKLGDTEDVVVNEPVEYPYVKVSKSQGSTGFGKYGGQFNDGEHIEVITIPNAAVLKVKVGCTFYTGHQKLYIASGIHDRGSIPLTGSNNYGNKNTEITYLNTQSVTFYYNDGWADGGNYGYYAEVWGLDMNGNYLESYFVNEDIEKTIPRVFTSAEVADAIDSMLEQPRQDAFKITGKCDYLFYNGSWDWFADQYKDHITTKDVSSCSYMFAYSKLTEVPFEINFDISKSNHEMVRMFNYAESLESVPKINNAIPYSIGYLFSGCKRLKNIPDDYFDNCDFTYLKNLTSGYSGSASGLFGSCEHVRSIPVKFLKDMNPYSTYTNSYFYSGFNGCKVLDELLELPIPYTQVNWISNGFASAFSSTFRLKNITFATPDGQPVVVRWKSQLIDLTATGYGNNGIYDFYNAGFTDDTYVSTPEQYEALKDNPDWFTTTPYCSRYNHDSAVRTINTLPDTSAYLSTAGGTNTIKFYGRAGEYSGGAINTLTAEEIAVATAKGWTVSMT